MKLLALDTSMQACSAAVLVKNGRQITVHNLFERLGRGHAERLMPMVDEVLALATIHVKELDRLAVSTGPGTFTGVRIGLAAARGLALALKLPLVGENSLRLIAADTFANASLQPGSLVGVVMDARRDQLYFQLFDEHGPVDQSGPRLLFPQQVDKFLPSGRNIFLVGSGLSLLHSHLDKTTRKIIHLSDFRAGRPQPDAAHLARLAVHISPTGKSLSPLYLRPADAKTQSGYAIERR